jgi:hypothetical protein
MGMKNSSDVFCHRTNDILSDVPDLIKVVDDLLLQAETEDELLSILHIALVACRKGNLTLSKDKIKWVQKIGFAGYITSNTGVYPDPACTLAIRQFPVPKDLSSLRGFLGLANQLGHFLPDLAHITVNLRLLLKKDVNFFWLQQPHQEDFELICKILTLCAADVFGRTQKTFPIFQSIRVISASIEGIYI